MSPWDQLERLAEIAASDVRFAGLVEWMGDKGPTDGALTKWRELALSLPDELLAVVTLEKVSTGSHGIATNRAMLAELGATVSMPWLELLRERWPTPCNKSAGVIAEFLARQGVFEAPSYFLPTLHDLDGYSQIKVVDGLALLGDVMLPRAADLLRAKRKEKRLLGVRMIRKIADPGAISTLNAAMARERAQGVKDALQETIDALCALTHKPFAAYSPTLRVRRRWISSSSMSTPCRRSSSPLGPTGRAAQPCPRGRCTVCSPASKLPGSSTMISTPCCATWRTPRGCSTRSPASRGPLWR